MTNEYLIGLGVKFEFYFSYMINRELKAASARPLILSILSHQKSYGYQIIQQIEMLSDGKLEWSEAMLYPLLHRMNSDGLIKSQWEIRENGRKRKYYMLTENGEMALAAEKKQWMNVHGVLQKLWGSKPQLSIG